MMKKLIFLLMAMLLLQISCNKEPQPEPQPDPPGPVVDTSKPRFVWIDAAANLRYFGNDKAYIGNEMKKIAACGFTDVVVDIRPTEGTVLYKSKVAPEAKRLPAWVGSQYKFVDRTATWDYLKAFIDAGHAAGLKVNAALNTFVGGYGGCYGLDDEGPIFSGDIPTSWATVQNTSEGVKSSFYDGVQGTVFLNPANDSVSNYMISLLKEVAAYEGIDGIFLDRCRFDDSGLQSDFSDVTKAKFVEYLGSEPTKWPVFNAGASSLPAVLTDEQKSWMAFRAKTIHDFVEKAADAVHAVNPEVRFGCYVGAWYSSYYTSGVNWASQKYDTGAKYPKWANSDYKNYGYADHCDFMLLGCYASASSIYGSTEWTMQGFCKLGKQILCGDTEFAGGPDVGNPDGWKEGKQSSKIWSTVDACINPADGYFVFDLCHIRMYDYWNAYKNAFDKYLNNN